MKTILITGASKGIGRALAEKLAGNNYRLILTARSAEQLNAIAEKLRKKGETVAAFPVDARDDEAVGKLLENVYQEFGAVEVLVNNAGLGIFNRVEDFADEDWYKVMETNVKSMLSFTKRVVPEMKKQQRGHIITVESDVAVRGEPQLGLYASSKFAQEGFTRSIRKELRPFGIRVSNVYPGVTDTDFHPDTPENRNREGWLQPEDIAGAIAYIISTPEHVVVDALTIHPKVQDY